MALTKYLILEVIEPGVFHYVGEDEGHSAAQAARVVLGDPGDGEEDGTHIAVPVSNWTVLEGAIEHTKPVRRLTEGKWSPPKKPKTTTTADGPDATVTELAARARGENTEDDGA